MGSLLLLLSLLTAARAQAPEGLTLGVYVQRVLERSPELQQAQRSLEAADAAYRSGLYSAVLPALSFTAYDYPWGDNPANGYRYNGPRLRSSDVGYNAGISLNLFNSFQDYRRVKGAAAARGAADWAFRAARQSRAFDAVRAYYDLVSRTKLLEVARRNLGSQQDQYRQTHDLYDHGLKSLADLLKGETDLRSSELRLVEAEAGRKSALARFNALADQAPWTEAGLDAELSPGATTLPQLEPDVERALAARPELRQARRGLEASEQALARSAQGLLPVLSLSADWAHKESASFGLPAASFGLPATSSQLTLTLALPFGYNGASQAYDFLGARAERDRTLAVLSSAERQVRQELYAAYAELERASGAYRVAAQKEEIAKSGLDLVAGQYRSGAADAIRLAQAQSDFLQAQVERASALRDIFVGRAQYRVAVGEPPW